jgi:3-oxoacyl-[acyl-carrier protein] reductase
MCDRLLDQNILVTGAVGGIGRQICLRLASEGARVWLNYHTQEAAALALRSELERHNYRARLAQADVTNPEQVARLLAEIGEAGGVQALVHAVSAPLTDVKFRNTEWAAFERHWRVNVQSAYLLTQGLLSANTDKRLESIVFILSSATLGIPPVEKSAYVTAKYALLGLARSLALELAPKGIRVNCVSPGFTATPLTAYVDDRIKELIVRSVPMKRLATPDDVAAAVSYLVSKDAAYVTGVNLPVTGGLVMQ